MRNLLTFDMFYYIIFSEVIQVCHIKIWISEAAILNNKEDDYERIHFTFTDHFYFS